MISKTSKTRHRGRADDKVSFFHLETAVEGMLRRSPAFRFWLGLGLLTCIGKPVNGVEKIDYAPTYQRIETYRAALSEHPASIENFDEGIVQAWSDLVWHEGWVRKAGWDVNMARIRSDLAGNEWGKKIDALQQLHEFTELIYADGSVGNVRKNAWVLTDAVTRMRGKENRVQLEFSAPGGERYGLEVSFFAGGVIHLRGEESGFFDEKDLTPARVICRESDASLIVEYKDEPIEIVLEKPSFAMKVYQRGVLKFHQVGFNVAESSRDPCGVRVRFAASEADEYLGFGERFDRFKHKHSIFAQWSMGMAAALEEGSSETYKPIPFYLNPVNATGVFYNHGGIVRWDLEGSERGIVDVTSVGGVCDYFLFVGDQPRDVYRAYTQITGRIFEVAEWVHLPWMGHHFGGVPTVAMRRERLVDELINYDKYGFTYGAMYAAGISSEGPEIQDIYSTYMEPLGLKLGTHLIPTVRTGRTEFNALPADHLEDYLIMREDGSLFVSDHAFQAGCAYYDYSSPPVINSAFRSGIHQIFMLDFGEQAAWDGVLSGYPHFNGRESHNLYQYLYQRAAYEAHEEKYPGGEWMSFARSGWAGSHALGGFFAGDTNCSMEDLVSTIRAGINFCASAGVYWGADIGAYRRQTPLTKERYLRWGQFGTFSPLMRTHAHESKEMRPWKYDDEMVEAYAFYTWLRASLVPYIRECGLVASAEGLPIMRALPIEFPGDEKAYVDDEYMFGPSLLVAPYVTEETHHRRVYLPAGTWFNFFTHEKHAGAVEIVQSSPDWKAMPVYVRAPAILPLRIGSDSPQPGDAHFQSAGTTRYANAAIDAFRIYPVAGRAQAEFSHATVVYEEHVGAVVVQVDSDTLQGKPLHLEVFDVPAVVKVVVGELVLSRSGSWTEMMQRVDRFFYDGSAQRLYVNTTGQPGKNTLAAR